MKTGSSNHQDDYSNSSNLKHELTDEYDNISIANSNDLVALPLHEKMSVKTPKRISERPSYENGSQCESNLSLEENELSRKPSRYSVKDIYGDMDNDDINLRRSMTRSTILTSLSHRAHDVIGVPDYENDIDDILSKQASYEELPDTSVPSKNFGAEFSSLDPELVTWDGIDDPEYPRNWTHRTKIFHTLIISAYTLISPMTSSILSPAMSDIGKDFHMNNFFMSFSVSIMVLAWALGPLLIAPISEDDRVGRLPVLNSSIWINCAFLLGCGFSKNTTQLCIFRFLGGLGGCAAINVGAGTVSDLWSDKERQFAMALYSICPTLGPIISPIVSSWIVEYTTWRWCFWALCIFNGAVALFGTIFFVETYSPKLLSNRAKRLRKETQNPNLHTIFEIADGETQMGKIVYMTVRPIKLLFTNPMIIGLGAFMAFTYGFLYLIIVTFPLIWQDQYGFSVGISGLMFLPMGISYIIATVFWTTLISKIYNNLTEKNNGVPKPEYRLPCLCASGIGLPIGLIWFGWSAEKQLHWMMPAIGSAIFAFFFIAVFLTIQNYLVDMNNRFAASSMAAAAVLRSLFGFVFPLFAHKMYNALGFGWGNTLFGFIGIALGIPFPIFCLKYGERLREWANRRMIREQALRDAKNLERLRKKEYTKEVSYEEKKI